MSKEASSPIAPLRNPKYLTYWLTGQLANFGWLIQLVGAAWLMTSIGGSPQLVGLVQTSISLPIALFALLAGALADTFGRRTMVMWAQSFLFITSIVLAAFAYLGLLTPWTLLTFTFLLGTCKAMTNPGWQTLVSEFMPREELPEAIALNSVGFNLARSVGPAIGGVIVATFGAFAAFATNAVCNFGMIAALSRWRDVPVRQGLPPEALGSAMLSGIRYAAMSPNLLVVMMRGAAFNFAGISIMGLMPLIAQDLVSGGAQTYGVLLGAFGLGAVGGALFGHRLRKAVSLEGLTRIGFISFAGATLTIALSNNVALTFAGAAIAGASWLLTISTLNATVQVSSPRWVVSRCQALHISASFGGNALGSWLWGFLAGYIGLSGSLIASGIALLIGAALGLRFRLTEFDTDSLDPHSRWVAPEPELDILPRSGPILATTTYRINPANVDEFLSVMAERRRTRTRDGARHWSLSRDIEHPEIWTERYLTATWNETIRHHQRRTKADVELADRVLALHEGNEPPETRYHLDRQTGRLYGDPSHLAVDVSH